MTIIPNKRTEWALPTYIDEEIFKWLLTDASATNVEKSSKEGYEWTCLSTE
jgi:hypothetical protein